MIEKEKELQAELTCLARRRKLLSVELIQLNEKWSRLQKELHALQAERILSAKRRARGAELLSSLTVEELQRLLKQKRREQTN